MEFIKKEEKSRQKEKKEILDFASPSVVRQKRKKLLKK